MVFSMLEANFNCPGLALFLKTDAICPQIL